VKSAAQLSVLVPAFGGALGLGADSEQKLTVLLASAVGIRV
jgi:hypothetical protein